MKVITSPVWIVRLQCFHLNVLTYGGLTWQLMPMAVLMYTAVPLCERVFRVFLLGFFFVNPLMRAHTYAWKSVKNRRDTYAVCVVNTKRNLFSTTTTSDQYERTIPEIGFPHSRWFRFGHFCRVCGPKRGETRRLFKTRVSAHRPGGFKIGRVR